MASDAKASGRWSTSGGGEYYAVGVGGALAGRGADLAIIDDPVSEQDALSTLRWIMCMSGTLLVPDSVYSPGGAIIIVMTRWSIRDLTAKVLAKQSEKGADKWDIVEFPAIMPSGESLWPEYWSLDELEGVKASIPVAKWNAQYMQNPTAEEGAIIKREWWNIWEKEDPTRVLTLFKVTIRPLVRVIVLTTVRLRLGVYFLEEKKATKNTLFC